VAQLHDRYMMMMMVMVMMCKDFSLLQYNRAFVGV